MHFMTILRDVFWYFNLSTATIVRTAEDSSTSHVVLYALPICPPACDYDINRDEPDKKVQGDHGDVFSGARDPSGRTVEPVEVEPHEWFEQAVG